MEGKWHSCSEFRTTKSPYSGKDLYTIANCTVDDINKAIAFAKHEQSNLQQLKGVDILSGLEELFSLFEKHSDNIISVIMEESAKPIQFSRGEFSRALATIKEGIVFASTLSGDMVPMEHVQKGQHKFAFQQRFPMGIVAAITPFNFPLNLLLHKLIPCIISKNAMVLKPAPQTSYTALYVADLFDQTSFPSSLFQVCPTADNAVAEHLVTHPDVQIVSFTGSSEVGKRIQKKAYDKKVLLECGGMASVIVHEDAHMDRSVDAIVSGAFAYAGQTCISVQHVYGHDSCYEALKSACLSSVESLLYGDPMHSDCVMSSLISKEATDRVREWVDEACKQGADCLVGNRVDEGVFVPTILENCNSTMKVSSSEVFGPVFVLHRYKDISEVIETLNSSSFGLQHSLFTKDMNVIFDVYQRLETGALLINESPTWRVDHMPYGGVKDSGNTKEGICYTYKELTTEKLCVIDFSHG